MGGTINFDDDNDDNDDDDDDNKDDDDDVFPKTFFFCRIKIVEAPLE